MKNTEKVIITTEIKLQMIDLTIKEKAEVVEEGTEVVATLGIL